MAKRGRDLFEILGSRLRDGAAGRRTARSAEVATPFEVGRGAVDRVRRWFGGGDPAPRRTARAAANAGGRGLSVAVACVLCLGTGFLVGRLTVDAASAPENRELRQTPATGEAPRWLATGVELSAEQEEEKLSNFSYRLLRYPALHRDRAAATARWLREQGVATARIRKMLHRGEPVFLVVCYVTQGDTKIYDKLKTLTTTPTEPQLAQAIAALALEPIESS